MATDEDLMRALAKGNSQALEELYHRYERPLYQFLARHLGTRHAGDRSAEDLHQETWLRVVRHAARFDPARRFSTWLFQIAINLCRDWHRRPLPVPVEPQRADRPDPDTNAAAIARIDLERLLQELPEPQRAVVLLRLYHDFSEADVATILDCARGTVKSRLHYAMEHLTHAVTRDET